MKSKILTWLQKKKVKSNQNRQEGFSHLLRLHCVKMVCQQPSIAFLIQGDSSNQPEGEN